MSFRILLIVSATLFLRIIVVISAQCFRQDGSIARNDLPCFRNESLSRCCPSDQFCSTNFLCVGKEGSPAKTSRGSCLDPAFGSTCPDFCRGSMYTNFAQLDIAHTIILIVSDNYDVAVWPCGDPSLGTFCCGEGNDFQCCEFPEKILTLGEGSTFLEGSKATGSLSLESLPNVSKTPHSCHWKRLLLLYQAEARQQSKAHRLLPLYMYALKNYQLFLQNLTCFRMWLRRLSAQLLWARASLKHPSHLLNHWLFRHLSNQPRDPYRFRCQIFIAVPR